MKIIVAHNALTAYKPKSLFDKAFNWMAKCQSINPVDLYKKGIIQGVDIRFRCTDQADIIAAHGLVDYNVDVFEVLRELNNLAYSKGEKLYVRIVNEDTCKCSNRAVFREYVDSFIATFDSLIIKAYDSKKAWSLYINQFKHEEEELIWTLDKGIDTPKSFAKILNPLFKTLLKKINTGMYYMDFIDDAL